MQRDKIETYIGLSMKSGAALFGKDNLTMRRQRFYVIIICRSAAANTRKDVLLLAERLKIKVIETKKSLSEITHKENCKVLAVCDKNLSKAILDNVSENYTLLS